MTKRKKTRRASKAGSYPHGRFEVTRHGYGFVETDEGAFYIGKHHHRGAMHGDEVEVRPTNSPSGRGESGPRRKGRIVRVMARNTEYLTGTLHIEDPLAVVTPTDPRFMHDIFVTLDECPEARDGDVVLVRILDYPARHVAASGYIVEVVGQAGKPGMDIDVLVHNAGLPCEFSPGALFEAKQVFVDEEAALAEPGRRDLRGRCVFTIDPHDAKDFDDALSFDRVEGLRRVGVHIADVSAYVPWDSSVDICARDRATSTYLPDRVIPMLPEALCNDVCSLRPGLPRLAMTCDMFFTDAGEMARYEIYPSLIRSSRRFTYDEVDEILTSSKQEEFKEKLLELNKFAKERVEQAQARGCLDFDFPEPKAVLDEEGHCVDIRLRRKSAATSLVEECMIAANECVARHLTNEVKRGIYRVHVAPKPQALEALLPTLKELGYPIEGMGGGSPKAYQRVLRLAAGRVDQPLVETMVLRSQEQAHYSTDPLGHFGLALKNYTHFTSPIRRYPDLMVHRLLKDRRAMEGQLEWLAEHSSKMERLAEETTRHALDLKICEYMAAHVGEEFVGTIVTVLAHGFFVKLENCAEGFVRLDFVKGEYFAFEPKTQTLAGEETGRTYRLGQQVRVRLINADPRTTTLDFQAV